MTKEQIAELYSLADIYYKKNKYDIERDDFRQMCALEAVKRLYNNPALVYYDKFLSDAVYYVHETNVLSKNNKKRKENKWYEKAITKVELDDPECGLELENTEHVDQDNQIYYKELLREAKKLLKPIEYKTFMLMYNGRREVDIAQILKITDRSVRNHVRAIREKLGDLK